MKAGDVCRCISNFTGISSEELTLYKNDIVQVMLLYGKVCVQLVLCTVEVFVHEKLVFMCKVFVQMKLVSK